MTNKQTDKTPDEQRESLITAALEHVAFDGWSKKTLNQAAKDIGVDAGIVDLAFPRGSIDMIDFHAQNCDIAMLNSISEEDFSKLKIREKITELVKQRILTELPHKEAAHRTVSFLALPNNQITSLKILYRTVDLMWKALADKSTDFNFYTKRMTLGAVYTTTFMYWLGDESKKSEETWEFLDRRIENVMQIEKVKAKYRDKKPDLQNIWRELGKKRYGA